MTFGIITETTIYNFHLWYNQCGHTCRLQEPTISLYGYDGTAWTLLDIEVTDICSTTSTGNFNDYNYKNNNKNNKNNYNYNNNNNQKNNNIEILMKRPYYQVPN